MERERVRIFFLWVTEMTNSSGMGVITLTDVHKKRSLNVICDKYAKEQLLLRTNEVVICSKLLPEVLTGILNLQFDPHEIYIHIYGVEDGEYQVWVRDVTNCIRTPIRFSDAVLLSVVASLPIYIDSQLMQLQSQPFVDYRRQADAQAGIPINTLSVERLKTELQNAIDREDFRKADLIDKELKRRTKK